MDVGETAPCGASTPYDVIHYGPYFCDLIFTGLGDLPQLGSEIYGREMQMAPGGAFNTTYALHRLGLKTGWITDFGVDFFSQFVLQKTRELGMDSRFFRIHTHSLCKLSVAFSFHEDRGFISYADSSEPFDLISILETHRPRYFLLGGLEHGAQCLEFARAARNLGVLLAMDCQHRDATLETPGVAETLQAVDIFLPNLCEAERLTGLDGAEAAARRLAQLTPRVVMKLGEQGALAAQGETLLHVPGIRVEVVDTTGAGDSFNAGYLYSALQGHDLETSLKYANLVGGASVTGHGVSQIPTQEQLERLIGQYDLLVQGAAPLPRQAPLGWAFGQD
jgi:sugar/nucleoside kinase (ribokinase family)